MNWSLGPGVGSDAKKNSPLGTALHDEINFRCAESKLFLRVFRISRFSGKAQNATSGCGCAGVSTSTRGRADAALARTLSCPARRPRWFHMRH
eukprot:2640986-Pleurochrysis_carterae.AAC.1